MVGGGLKVLKTQAARAKVVSLLIWRIDVEFNITPLPWSLDVDGDLMAADRTLVAIIPSAKDRPLLAAAPEMLSALKWVAESSSREGDEFGMWAAVDAAIAKAESNAVR